MTSTEAKSLLRSFLHHQKMDQKDFARLIGKSEVTLSRWLNSDVQLSESNINAIRFVIGNAGGGGNHANISGVHAGDINQTSGGGSIRRAEAPTLRPAADNTEATARLRAFVLKADGIAPELKLELLALIEQIK